MRNAPWAVVKIALFIIIVEAVVLGGGIYLLFSHQIYGLNATIQASVATNKTLKEGAKNLESLIGEYRERLHLIPGVNLYKKMMNAEVTAEARKLVETLREEERQYRAESDQISRVQMEESIKAASKITTDEEQNAVMMKYGDQFRKLLERQKAQYEQQHKNDAILIHEEMLSRIPKEDREKIRDHRFAYIPPWFYEEIIDDLEMLASMLSGSPSSPPQK